MNRFVKPFRAANLQFLTKRMQSSSASGLPKASVPLFGLAVGLSAFAFQTMVLYPWHDELSEQFDRLQEVVLRVEKMNLALSERMETVVRLEEEVKAKERRILDKTEEIARQEALIAARLDALLMESDRIGEEVTAN